jgi:hypothetical protein
MPKSMKHPVTGFVYALTDDGRVQVSDPASDRFGIFDSTGRWFSGEIRDADPQILGWVGRLPAAREVQAADAEQA